MECVCYLVMSEIEIECAQMHSELLGRRHSTLQSHDLFAVVKHFFLKCRCMASLPSCMSAVVVILQVVGDMYSHTLRSSVI